MDKSFCFLRYIAIVMAAVFPFLAAPSPGQSATTSSSETRELVFLNWADYIDPELVAEFEQKFNAKVKQIYFADDQARDTLMLRADGKGYDLALVDGTTLKVYHKRGWLSPLDESRIPNLRNIDAQWRNAHEIAAGYAAPYFWGTLGIAYRSDLVPEEITSWKQLFQSQEALRDRILMVRDNRDLISAALMALGHSPNTTDAQSLSEAEALLMAQKPYVHDYSYLSLTEESALVRGEVWAAMMYNGDALVLKEHHDDIVYVTPEEGTVLWVDYLVVLESSPNKDLAMAFIDFLNEPENAARLAEHVYYPTPNRAAEIHLPAEFLEDEDIYPEEGVLGRSEFYVELPPRIMRAYIYIVAKVVR